MLGLHFEAKTGLVVIPLLFLGYTATDYFLQFLNTGVSTRCDIDVIDHKFSIIWKIGKTIRDN